MTIKEVKKGDFFRFSETGRVFVRGDYDRSERKYEYYPFDDVNDWHLARGSRKVIADFEL